MKYTCFNSTLTKQSSKMKSEKHQMLSHIGLFATPMGCTLPGSSAHGIFQARILEWVAIPFSGGLPKTSPALQADSLPS